MYFPFYRTTNKKHVPEDLLTALGSPSGWGIRLWSLLLFTKADVIIETEAKNPIKMVKSRKVQSAKNFLYDPEQKKLSKNLMVLLVRGSEVAAKYIVERNGKVIFEVIPQSLDALTRLAITFNNN